MQNQQGIGNSQTTVSSFDLATGAINWSYTGNFVFPSQPGVGGGFVAFVGSSLSSSWLYVLDALTGSLRYTIPIPEDLVSMMPTVVQDQISGNVTAFVADGSLVSAFSLGATSGSFLWTQTGEFGGFSIPTVVGSSIVLAGPGQYYAFDQVTGAANHFWSGAIEGGGGTTVAYDATRQQFYVLEDYNGPTPTLSAYSYTDNAHIALLWQRTGAGVGYSGASVAIGPTGNVYSAGNGVIWELDPATGTTLRSIPGSFANVVTPALTNNVLWIIGKSQVFAYDLITLQLLRAFNGSRGDLSSPYDSPGAFTDGYFVLDYGNIYGSHSFDVYSVASPTPTPTPTPTPSRVTLSAAPTQMREGHSAIYSVTASMPALQSITVNYGMSGTATLNTDYRLSGVPGQVTIEAGQSAGKVTLTSRKDTETEGTETAIMTLQPGSGYKLGNPRQATVSILDTP
jgi:hypothetical protein